jgi:predicted nucleotidyltransferase component of viral defense system
MITVAKSGDIEREVLFGNAADRAGINNPAIVEKDFWVCFALDYLFHKSPWSQSFIFKGGTSLSKAYHVSERFSEDILTGVRKAMRYQNIEVEYYDSSWRKHREAYSGWTAQIIQHECDHLEGIII